MKKLILEIARKTALFLAVLSVLWLALVSSLTIPNEKIAENMEKSALRYKNIGAFSFENGGKLNAVSDNYADSIILNLSYNMGRGNPFKSSLDTNYYSGDEAGLNLGLYRTVKEDVLPDTEYTRYWHGTAMILRVMHLFTDAKGIKAAGLIVILLLLSANLFALCKKRKYITAMALLLGAGFVHIWNTGLSLEYQSSFIVGFSACLAFLITEERREKALSYLALVSGCMVAFFDFLTTETVAILLPLVLVTSVRIEGKRLTSVKEHMKMLINSIISYGCGYGFTFVSKWVLVSLITEKNCFSEVFTKSQALFEKSGETANNLFVRMINAVMANFTALFGGKYRIDYFMSFIYIFVIALAIFSLIYVFGKKEKIKGLPILLLLGVLVILRYMALPGHSYMHNFFTYRALISTLTAIFASVGLSLNVRRVKRSGKN